MTAREAARRYSAIDERAPVGFATALLHHWRGHDHGGLDVLSDAVFDDRLFAADLL
jgi:hypothetical protein